MKKQDSNLDSALRMVKQVFENIFRVFLRGQGEGD
jgi:hypothetical protein